MVAMKAGSTTPSAFTTVFDCPRHAVVRREWEGSIASALLHGDGCESVASDGRGTLQRFHFGGGTGLIRTYRRGGAIGPLLDDRMFLVNRPLRELRLLAYLHAKDLPVPNPLGCRWTRSGLVYRGAIATEEIDAHHLQHVLETSPDRAPSILPGVGETIRKFHDIGVFHADLQIRNILVAGDRVYLIDFDRTRVYPVLSPHQRWKNLLRLRRSLEKNGLPLAHFDAIREGYGVKHLPNWLDAAYRVKGRVSDSLQGREAPRP